LPAVYLEPLNKRAKHDALREGRDQRAAAERRIPQAPQPWMLEPEFERDAAENKRQ
jgi:hypothetical protein